MTATRMRQPTASPLSLHRHLPERSSPSRVRFVAQNRRALDHSGPFRKLSQIRERGQLQSPNQSQFAADCCLPLIGLAITLSMLTRPPNPKIRPPPVDDVNNLQA
jgi:hypothetical protein